MLLVMFHKQMNHESTPKLFDILQSPGQLEKDIDEMMKEDTGYDADMSTMTMYVTPRDRKQNKVHIFSLKLIRKKHCKHSLNN